MFTWIEDKTRTTQSDSLSNQAKLSLLHQALLSNPALQTHLKPKFLLYVLINKQNIDNNKRPKGQHSKGPPQGHGTEMKKLSRYIINSDILTKITTRRVGPANGWIALLFAGISNEISRRGSDEQISSETTRLFSHLSKIMNLIIQRNCRGLKINVIETTLLVQALLTIAFCLQVTHLKKVTIKPLHNYSYSTNVEADERAECGSTFLVMLISIQIYRKLLYICTSL